MGDCRDTVEFRGRGDYRLEKYRVGPGETEEDVLKRIYANQQKPYEVQEQKDVNVWLTGMKTEMLKLCTGSSTNHFDSSHTHIGVGSSGTAAAASDTALLGTSTEYKGMMSGYPTTPSAGSFQVKSIFLTSEGNFAWNELVVRQSTSLQCWNRNTTGWSTKASTDIWTMTVTLTLL
jgi:hypothetical protein